MQCQNKENNNPTPWLNLSSSTTTEEISQYRFAKLTRYQQPVSLPLSDFNWTSISFPDGKPQQAFLSPDEKYVILKIKEKSSCSEYLTIYDLSHGQVYCSFRSENFQIDRHHWISPQFLQCNFYSKMDESTISVLDINTSTMWIFQEKADGHQLFHVSDDSFIVINKFKIFYYNTNTNQCNVSINCDISQLKLIGIKPFKEQAFPFMKNVNCNVSDNDDQECEYIGRCMKLNTISMLIIPRYISETQHITKQLTPFAFDDEEEFQYSEPEYYEDEVEVLTAEIYLLDLRTDKILKTNVNINGMNSIHVFYSPINHRWHWSDNSKFYVVTKDHDKQTKGCEYNIILTGSTQSSDAASFKIESTILQSIGASYDIQDGNTYAEEQIVRLQNILVKGTSKEECVYESMAIGYDPFDKDEYESTYYHVLYPLDQSSKCIKYEIDYIHQAFIDQLSGLILVQSKYKYLDKPGYYDRYGEWTHPYKLGFAVMNPLNGKKIGFISFPENTYKSGTIFADFGTTILLVSGYGTNKIYYCPLYTKQQLENILKYVSSLNKDGFGLLDEALLTVIVDFIYA